MSYNILMFVLFLFLLFSSSWCLHHGFLVGRNVSERPPSMWGGWHSASSSVRVFRGSRSGGIVPRSVFLVVTGASCWLVGGSFGCFREWLFLLLAPPLSLTLARAFWFCAVITSPGFGGPVKPVLKAPVLHVCLFCETTCSTDEDGVCQIDCILDIPKHAIVRTRSYPSSARSKADL